MSGGFYSLFSVLLKLLQSSDKCSCGRWNWPDWTSGFLECSWSQRKQPTVRDATLSFSHIFFLSFFFLIIPSPIYSSLVFGLCNVCHSSSGQSFVFFAVMVHSQKQRESQWMYVDIWADLLCRPGFVSSHAACLPPCLAGGWSRGWVAGSVKHPYRDSRCCSLTFADSSH